MRPLEILLLLPLQSRTSCWLSTTPCGRSGGCGPRRSRGTGKARTHAVADDLSLAALALPGEDINKSNDSGH